MDERNSEVCLRIGDLRVQEKEMHRARTWYLRALRRDRKSTVACNKLGTVHVNLGENRRALKWFRCENAARVVLN